MDEAKKTIKDTLKDHGLEIAEDTAVATVKGFLNALPAILLATENKIDDLLIPMIEVLTPKIIELLDKIDGEIDS